MIYHIALRRKKNIYVYTVYRQCKHTHTHIQVSKKSR